MDLTIVEVVIGLAFLFFLISIISSALNEGIAGVFKLRSKMLEQGIVNLVTGNTVKGPATDAGGIVTQLYDHALVKSYGQGSGKPSYMASRTFRNALFDITGLLDATGTQATTPAEAAEVGAKVQAAIDAIPNENLKMELSTLWRASQHDATEFRVSVERWFDRSMERVSGWYKRRAQIILFALGLGVAVAANANAVWAADHLWKDDGIRKGLVAEMGAPSATPPGSDAVKQLDDLGFPIGWDKTNRPDGAGEWVIVVSGWLITGVAVSFGAPFWFDVLNKFANLRASGPKPETVLPAATAKTETNLVRLVVSGDTTTQP